MDRASVFRLGRSQVVRLPKSCRFELGVRSVRARKLGNAVILEPVEMAGWDPSYWASVQAMPTMEEEVTQIAIAFQDISGRDDSSIR